MGDKILAGIVIVVCAMFMLRLMLGERRRYRFDAVARRLWASVRIRALRLWHWRAARRQARRDAEDVIRRARGADADGEWDGNVYKPKSFKGPRKLH
jgi:hypothetical protein